MQNPSPTDELAELGADMSRLKLLMAVLRTKMLAAPETQPIGRWHRIELQEIKSCVLDAKLLSDDMRNDPEIPGDVVSQVLPVLPVGSNRPGWPIQRDNRAVQEQAGH